MPKEHNKEIRDKVRELYEISWLKPAQIHERTGIPVSTINSWKLRYRWRRSEETTLNLTLGEFKKVLHQEEYSDRDLRKMNNLRQVIDEYSERRNVFILELEILINRLKGSPCDKTSALGEVVELINRHTGADLKMKQRTGKGKPNDFRGLVGQ